MLNILPIIALASLILAWAAQLRSWRAGALAAAACWGGLVWLFTEGGGSLGVYAQTGMALAWGAACLVLAGVCVMALRRARLPAPGLAGADWFSRLLLLGVIVIIIVTGAIGLVYAPTNYDSLTYHLSRAAHWAQNGSVAFYPSNIDRQNFLEPFAEYVTAQLYLLAGGDALAFCAQWLAFIGCILGASYLAELLGGKPRAQAFAAIFAASLPMAILQASSAQNDLVSSFWLVCVAVFALRLMGRVESKRADVLLFAISLGLALLTKATLRIYAFPIALWAGGWMALRLRAKALAPLALISLIVVAINLPFVGRNYALYGPTLTPAARAGTFTNAAFTPGILFSNALRNAALHFAVPRADLNKQWIVAPISSLHAALGLDVSDPRSTYPGSHFSISDQPYFEDTAGNPLHLVLSVFALALLLARSKLRQNKWRMGLALVVILDFILFCAVLRWQPWHSRLHLPLFALFAPLVALAFDEAAPRWIAIPIFAALLAAAYFPLARNYTRPLNQFVVQLNAPRENRYMDENTRRRYQTLMSRIESAACRSAGLALSSNSPEYFLWVMRPAAQPPILFQHVLVGDESSGIKERLPPPCAVIYQNPPQPAFELNGQKFALVWKEGDLSLFFAAP